MISRLIFSCSVGALASVWLGGFVRSAPENEVDPRPVEASLAGQMGLPFADHAVLQQKMPLPVWGMHSLPGTKVTLQFDGQSKETEVDANGRWEVTLDPMTAEVLSSVNDSPEGKAMTVVFRKGDEKAEKTIRGLLVGEVWLCAGQSNMAGKMRTTKAKHYPENSIELAKYPAFRQFVSPEDEKWLVCSPETAPEFKKVCFFFGRRILEETLVPVGVFNAAVGGSNIESWLNQQPYPTGKHYEEKIRPLVPYGIRGVVWYQGESNAKSDGYAYLPKLKSLITGWRSAWDQPASAENGGPRTPFSFYYVQLPGIGISDPLHPEMGDGRAGIRRAYQDALQLPHTGMAVCHDIGDQKEHPPNKYDTGIRLAQLALHHDYGRKGLLPSGPVYQSHKIEGKTIRVQFHHADGLMVGIKEGFPSAKPSPDAKLGWLSIQAKDGTWHWAEGKIDGSDLVVSSPEVTEAIAVRYAYTDNPNGPLLYNNEGLPAAPFATDVRSGD